MPRAISMPNNTPPIDPITPVTALSPRNSHRICARVAPRAFGLGDRDARFEPDVDTIERPAAPEHFLRGIDVHDREVAAERARQAAGLHHAANRELPPAENRAQRDRVVD